MKKVSEFQQKFFEFKFLVKKEKEEEKKLPLFPLLFSLPQKPIPTPPAREVFRVHRELEEGLWH
jgi:hypothetical protein